MHLRGYLARPQFAILACPSTCVCFRIHHTPRTLEETISIYIYRRSCAGENAFIIDGAYTRFIAKSGNCEVIRVAVSVKTDGATKTYSYLRYRHPLFARNPCREC